MKPWRQGVKNGVPTDIKRLMPAIAAAAPPFTIDDIYVHIFSWKHVTANALELYRRVAPHFPQTFFINCDENTPIAPETISGDRVLQLDDRYYYGGQFNTALKNTPEGKILACIVGDVEPAADWAAIAARAVAAFNAHPIGIYAPNVDYTWWTMRNAHIAGDLYEVPNTDCTCWFLHPKLTGRLRIFDYYLLSNLGWGIDAMYCKEAVKRRMHIARDYGVMVRQPRGTAYDQTKARSQMQLLMTLYGALADS